MFSGRRMSSSSSSPAGVVARASSSAAVNAGIRQPDWLEMVTPAPPGAMTLPTSSTSKPASFMVLATARAFSIFLSPMTIFIP